MTDPAPTRTQTYHYDVTLVVPVVVETTTGKPPTNDEIMAAAARQARFLDADRVWELADDGRRVRRRRI